MRLRWPDSFRVNYGYDPTGAMTAITQGAAGSVISLCAYDGAVRVTFKGSTWGREQPIHRSENGTISAKRLPLHG